MNRAAALGALSLCLLGCAAPSPEPEAPAPARGPDAEPQALLPADPVELTHTLIALASWGDGATLVTALHPELRAVWERQAAARGMALEDYALGVFAPAALGQLGHVTGSERKRVGPLRCEVELDFSKKHRDVDFGYAWLDGAWRLERIDDYP